MRAIRSVSLAVLKDVGNTPPAKADMRTVRAAYRARTDNDLRP